MATKDGDMEVVSTLIDDGVDMDAVILKVRNKCDHCDVNARDANLPELLGVRPKLVVKIFPMHYTLTEFTTAQPPFLS